MTTRACAQFHIGADANLCISVLEWIISATRMTGWYLPLQNSGLVKPDIVFFGENLPERFYDSECHTACTSVQYWDMLPCMLHRPFTRVRCPAARPSALGMCALSCWWARLCKTPSQPPPLPLQWRSGTSRRLTFSLCWARHWWCTLLRA